MSKGRWKRDPLTGITLAKLADADECYLTDDGNANIAGLEDCNVFCVNSIAALCGFEDVRHFRDKVLIDPNCPIHVHTIALTAAESTSVVATIYATHTNSARAGGESWHAMMHAAARQRALTR